MVIVVRAIAGHRGVKRSDDQRDNQQGEHAERAENGHRRLESQIDQLEERARQHVGHAGLNSSPVPRLQRSVPRKLRFCRTPATAEPTTKRSQLAAVPWTAPSSPVARAQPVLPHPPDEKFDAILAEEGLPREDHGRHAPVPRRLERALVLRDDGVVASGGLRDRDVERSEVETRSHRRVGEVRALVPVLRAKGVKRGLGYQTMLKMIVMEHLDEY